MRRFPNLVILLIYCKYTYGITCLELCFTGVVLLIVVVTVTGAAVVVILPIVVVCFDCLLTVNWGSSVVVSGSGVRLVVALVSGRDVRLEVADSVRNAVHMRSISFLETIWSTTFVFILQNFLKIPRCNVYEISRNFVKLCWRSLQLWPVLDLCLCFCFYEIIIYVLFIVLYYEIVTKR
jgi:hypothetical protein